MDALHTPLGWVIHYADRELRGETAEHWALAPAESVQVVVQYFAETYRCWIGDHWEERHYRHVWSGADYYWMHVDGVIAAGSVRDVPASVLPKEGRWLPDDAYLALFNRVYATDDGVRL